MQQAKLQPGVPIEVAANIWRVVAPNAGVMTGPGTNSYIVGAARKIIVDPGPAVPAHVAALLAATDGRPAFVLTTHTHMDHSPAAMLLAAEADVELIGMPPPAGSNQDQTLVPHRVPADGEALALAGEMMRCVHTPGHASNHLCFYHAGSRLLFTGDHVMQGGTVVIPPPDGDMAAYMQSLEKIRAVDMDAIAPGHGVLMRDTDRVIRRLLRHRLQREARVCARLEESPGATLDMLLPGVYSDVPVARHPVARYSLHAHLLKLLAEGRVSHDADRWTLLIKPET